MIKDSNYSMTVEEYIQVITDIGFEPVLMVPFTDQNGVNLYQQFYARRDGLVLVFDEFQWNIPNRAPEVNSAKVYYNWKRNDPAVPYSYTSSGGFCGPNGESLIDSGEIPRDQYIWSGDHDARNLIRFKIQKLEENGTFLERWVQPPFLWFLNYMDTKGEYDFKAINRERIALLPEWVQQIIGSYDN